MADLVNEILKGLILEVFPSFRVNDRILHLRNNHWMEIMFSLRNS